MGSPPDPLVCELRLREPELLARYRLRRLVLVARPPSYPRLSPGHPFTAARS